jgi:hypothetical protein
VNILNLEPQGPFAFLLDLSVSWDREIGPERKHPMVIMSSFLICPLKTAQTQRIHSRKEPAVFPVAQCLLLLLNFPFFHLPSPATSSKGGNGHFLNPY